MIVKICGITNREDALSAADAGATALGFIFYDRSPRATRPTRASKVRRVEAKQRRSVTKRGRQAPDPD